MVELKVIFCGDENVVHVNLDVIPILHHYGLEDSVYCLLECSRGILESEPHYHWFKLPNGGFEHGFLLVTFCYSDVIEAPSNVEFGIQGSPMEPFN